MTYTGRRCSYLCNCSGVKGLGTVVSDAAESCGDSAPCCWPWLGSAVGRTEGMQRSGAWAPWISCCGVILRDSGGRDEVETPGDSSDLKQSRANRFKATIMRIKGKTTREEQSALRAAENNNWRNSKTRRITCAELRVEGVMQAWMSRRRVVQIVSGRTFAGGACQTSTLTMRQPTFLLPQV